MLGPIETRAVSAAFLREFTESQVTHELAAAASADAVTFLTEQIQTVSGQLIELTKHSRSGERRSLTRMDSKQVRSQQQLSAKLDLLKLDLAKRKRRPFMTTRDVHRLIIKRQTDDSMCRFLELRAWSERRQDFSTGSRACVGPATSFVSHSWDSPWEALVDALCEHSERLERGGEQPFYWVDIFAVNQHWPTGSCAEDCHGCLSMKDDLPDWETMQQGRYDGGFGRVLAFAKHVLVLMEPWNHPRPPTRVWCLFEMYNCLEECGGRADIVLSRTEQQAMQVALAQKFGAFQDLIVGIDARDAEVTVPSDLDNIFCLIENSDGGFARLNESIRNSMFLWLAESGLQLLQLTGANAPKRRREEIDQEVMM
jgi:hypothetical protein